MRLSCYVPSQIIPKSRVVHLADKQILKRHILSYPKIIVSQNPRGFDTWPMDYSVMVGAVGRLEGIKVVIWLAVAELQNVLIFSFQGQDECRWVVFWWKLDQGGSPEEEFGQACHGCFEFKQEKKEENLRLFSCAVGRWQSWGCSSAKTFIDCGVECFGWRGINDAVVTMFSGVYQGA